MTRSWTNLCLFCSLFCSVSTDSNAHPKLESILKNAPTLNPNALKSALRAYNWALTKHKIANKNILTLIDFNLPSYKKRVWVIDLKHNQVLMKLYTTQGRNSGRVYAHTFSNKLESKQTSLGVYKTLNVYHGQHGLSERLQGLLPGINNNALKRAIVIHPAWYATPHFVQKYHRTGNSWGCFALSPSKIKAFINLTKGGSVIYAYNTALDSINY